MDGPPKPGLLMLGNAGPDRMVQVAQLAERSGFGQIWLADERFYREVYSYLTLFAVKTKLVALVRHHRLRDESATTAAAIGTIDELSGGRALLGIGAGLSGFAAMGVVRRNRCARWPERFSDHRELLTGGTVDYRGEILSFHNSNKNQFPAAARRRPGLYRQQWHAQPGPRRPRGAGRYHGGLRHAPRGEGLRCSGESRRDQGGP